MSNRICSVLLLTPIYGTSQWQPRKVIQLNVGLNSRPSHSQSDQTEFQTLLVFRINLKNKLKPTLLCHKTNGKHQRLSKLSMLMTVFAYNNIAASWLKDYGRLKENSDHTERRRRLVLIFSVCNFLAMVNYRQEFALFVRVNPILERLPHTG